MATVLDSILAVVDLRRPPQNNGDRRGAAPKYGYDNTIDHNKSTSKQTSSGIAVVLQ